MEVNIQRVLNYGRLYMGAQDSGFGGNDFSETASELLQNLHELRERALQESGKSELTAKERDRMEAFDLRKELQKDQGTQ